MITIEDFSKIEIKIGTVLEATKVPDADKLIRFVFDFGADERSEVALLQTEPEDKVGTSLKKAFLSGTITILPELAEKYPGKHVRQIMSAIAPFYPDPSVLVGKQIAVVTNLEPRKFRGYESQGMIVASDNGKGVVLMIPEKPVKPGAKIH